MKEKINQIKNRALSSPCRYIIIFLIVFFIVFFVSYMMLLDFEHTVNSKEIEYIGVTVADKFVSGEGHYYVIVGEDNKTYSIMDTDPVAVNFNNISVGKHYNLVIQRPQHENEHIRIIQVYNGTK